MSLNPTPATASKPRRIALATFGSFGDLNPFIALAMELRQRGHDPVIATSASYRQKIESAGIGFRPVRPDFPDFENDPAVMKRFMSFWTGPQAVFRDWLIPALRDSYIDSRAALDGAALLVAHPLAYGARLAAEERGIRWVSTSLAPIMFLSRFDPPALSPSGARPDPRLFRWLTALMKWRTHSWFEPWRRMRAELRLPPNPDPLFDGQHSPELALALFSEKFGARQPDWPAQARATGFLFNDREVEAASLPPDLERFLDDGPPPIVFTLGSSAVMNAGRFYEHSATAAARLKKRAVLLIGSDPRNQPAGPLPPGVVAFSYAPYSMLFPRAAATVHQGGIGTTAQAMRAGRPMLVMPFAHDQPDNAARVARLGIGRTIRRGRYNAESAARELRRLFEDESYASTAAKVGEEIRRENGGATACDAIEALWDNR